MDLDRGGAGDCTVWGGLEVARHRRRFLEGSTRRGRVERKWGVRERNLVGVGAVPTPLRKCMASYRPLDQTTTDDRD